MVYQSCIQSKFSRLPPLQAARLVVGYKPIDVIDDHHQGTAGALCGMPGELIRTRLFAGAFELYPEHLGHFRPVRTKHGGRTRVSRPIPYEQPIRHPRLANALRAHAGSHDVTNRYSAVSDPRILEHAGDHSANETALAHRLHFERSPAVQLEELRYRLFDVVLFETDGVGLGDELAAA